MGITAFRRLAPLCLVCCFGSFAAAAPPNRDADKARVVGQPVSLTVQPDELTLVGPRSAGQLVVTGRYADGGARDLTPFCEFTLDGESVARVGAGGFVLPRKDGTAILLVKAGGRMARVPVRVRDFDRPQPVSFRHEVIASFNVGGCNAGACHGTPSGKNGFKLSLRGYDPSSDYVQLTQDVLGRRTDRNDPDASLILLKALAKVPHEGGQKFLPHSVPADTVHQWLAEGLRDDPANLPAVKHVEVLPGSRLLAEPARWQQLAVRAHLADGQTRDVTRLTVFSSSDPAIASVTPNGLVEFLQSGEVAVLCRYLDEMAAVRLTYLEPKKGFRWTGPPENNYIDRHVFAKLKMLSILPSDLCADQEFLRRVYLDVCGILPTPQETRAFLENPARDKRAKLIDQLLERPEYADFWTLKWSDVLRSSRKTVQVKGTYVFQQWLRGHIAKNTPFDAVTRELLTAKGSTFANPPANYYRIARDPTSLAETTAQLFFGIRMQCAKCHNHPFERWTQDDYYSFAAFFARVKQKQDRDEPGTGNNGANGAEFIYLTREGEVVQPRTNKAMPPRVPGVKTPDAAALKDRRELLAKMATSPENPFFAKSVVNRIWYHLTGKGIVDPVDDFRDSNPSANDELLDALAKDFTDHHFDLKHIVRTILNSRTYQLSAETNEFNKDDAKYFSHVVTKRLTAEQLFDALCYATDVSEKFAGMPPGTRSVQLPDGEAANNPFLKTFGQPARELACECEREEESNLAQALQLINGQALNDRLRNPNNRIGKLLARKTAEPEMLNELFLATLSRLPNGEEARTLLDHVRQSANRRQAWEDVHWTLMNTKEFLFRH
jgi:hypothetical protein